MTKIVGILNATPDSFSDGGEFCDENLALKQLAKMLDEGAEIVDVGAESTRPNATPIDHFEEKNRLEKILPKVVEFCAKFSSKHNKEIFVSLDSRHFETIKWAHEIGVDIINDVSGLVDEKIVDFVAKNNVKTVFMHSLSVPADPDIIINSAINVVDEILKWGREKISFLQKKGVKKSQLIFDPGIGFSKNSQQSIRILKNITRFREFGLPIYVGHSKKRFLDEIYQDWPNDADLMAQRAKKTLMVSAFLAKNNVDFIRVHDVGENFLAVSSKNFEKF